MIGTAGRVISLQGRSQGSRCRQETTRSLAVLGVVLALAAGLCAAAWPRTAAAQMALGRAALRDAEANLPKGTNIDLDNGLKVVMGLAQCTGKGQCAACYQCHQIRGAGSVTANIPRLTGQTFRYLYASLRNFASGRRDSPTMAPIAQALTPADMRDVAAFYAAQNTRTPLMAAYAAEKSQTTEEILSQGGKMAAVGIPDRGVQACQNCHGPDGGGLPPIYPYLAGQYADYIVNQLNAFKSGARGIGDAGIDVMEDIAKRLTAGQMNDVAQYYSAIRPPRIVRDENYAGALAIGPPLLPEAAVRGAEGSGDASGNGQGQAGARIAAGDASVHTSDSGQAQRPDQKLPIPPGKIP